jgi:hypothetical protein
MSRVPIVAALSAGAASLAFFRLLANEKERVAVVERLHQEGEAAKQQKQQFMSEKGALIQRIDGIMETLERERVEHQDTLQEVGEQKMALEADVHCLQRELATEREGREVNQAACNGLQVELAQKQEMLEKLGSDICGLQIELARECKQVADLLAASRGLQMQLAKEQEERASDRQKFETEMAGSLEKENDARKFLEIKMAEQIEKQGQDLILKESTLRESMLNQCKEEHLLELEALQQKLVSERQQQEEERLLAADAQHMFSQSLAQVSGFSEK